MERSVNFYQVATSHFRPQVSLLDGGFEGCLPADNSGRMWATVEGDTAVAVVRGREGLQADSEPGNGCYGYTCSSFCDKAMLAVCIEGHIMRFVATPFRHAASHGPLAIITDAFIQGIGRILGLNCASYVDDDHRYIIMGRKMLWYGECVGLDRWCECCRQALPSAHEADKQTHGLPDELHMTRLEKGCTVGRGFISVICDTHNGVFRLTERKVQKLMDDLAKLLALDQFSRREAANVRGKMVNYGHCMEGIRPFSVQFTVFIGWTTSGSQSLSLWDEKVRTPDSLRENAEYLYGVDPRLAKAGLPIRQMDQATADRHGLPAARFGAAFPPNHGHIRCGCVQSGFVNMHGAAAALALGGQELWPGQLCRHFRGGPQAPGA